MTLCQPAQHCNNILFDCNPQNKTPTEQTENTVCLPPPPPRLARVIKIQFLFLRASCKHKFQMQPKKKHNRITITTTATERTTTTTRPHKIEKLTRFPYIIFLRTFLQSIFHIFLKQHQEPQAAVGIFPFQSSLRRLRLDSLCHFGAGQLCWPEGAGTGASPTFDELCWQNFWRISC